MYFAPEMYTFMFHVVSFLQVFRPLLSLGRSKESMQMWRPTYHFVIDQIFNGKKLFLYSLEGHPLSAVHDCLLSSHIWGRAMLWQQGIRLTLHVFVSPLKPKLV
jgi:hypothetical protein